jgi:hypothetical protein
LVGPFAEMPTPGKRYRIQDGSPLKKILAVTKHADGPVSMVQYTVGVGRAPNPLEMR